MPPTARRSARGLAAVALLTAAGLVASTAADPAKPPPAPRFPFTAEEAKEY